MKTGILLLLLWPCFVRSQDIALVDRDLKRPMMVTRELTLQQLSDRFFPIYTADLDSVIRFTQALITFINTGLVHEAEMQLLHVGHSQFAITTQRTGVNNSYMIFLSTRCKNLGASLELVKRDDNSRKAVQQILLFLDYLKNNRHILEKEESR